MKVYWMVHNPDGTWPREKHETEFDAGKEAERQATAYPGEVFNVLKVVGSCVAKWKKRPKMKPNELKRCPFCGKKAAVPKNPYYYWIECRNKKCPQWLDTDRSM